ncbi:hypothetical protein [Shewanella kaireitica]|uniref:hypothetical protein n=1 Tax=Shewanella kaireitica TaxID=212021 RepID=UPI00200E67E7|nr:hypothetical protein [Shewanella kaireitica]MCL1092781.1 hypothetical protein [Shewanella kaireitica]
MQHCTSPLFINDNFCPDCGDKVDNQLTITPVAQCIPDILDELKTYCPEASIYTGWVEKTHHYKRVHRSGGKDSQTLYYSYWFLTLNNEQGIEKTISVSSEDSSLDSVSKGDVITFLEPTGYYLNYQLADKSDRQIVTHNEAATGVVFHRHSGQESILLPAYEVEDFSKFGTFLSTLFLAALVSLPGAFAELYTFEVAGFIAAAITVIGSVFRINSKTNKFETESARLLEIKRTVKRILGVSISQMGYDKRGRTANNDDVYCINCEHLINSSYHYCHCCGQPQNITEVAQPSLITDADSSAVNEQISSQSHALSANNGNVTPITQASNKRMTRRDKIMQVCAPYMGYDSHSFENKHIFAKNYACTIATSSSIVRVTDKEVETSVSDKTNTYTSTTRTDYTNRYGSTVRSEYRTETSSHRQRNSNLYGELTIETPDGKIQTYKAARSLLSTADVGDWIMLGSSRLEGKAEQLDYDEFYYNISKDNLIQPESVTQWSRVSAKSQTFVFLMFALAIGCSVYFNELVDLAANFVPHGILRSILGFANELSIPAYLLPMGVFTVFFIFVIFLARGFSKDRKRDLSHSLASLKAKLAKCQQERESFLKL